MIEREQAGPSKCGAVQIFGNNRDKSDRRKLRGD
jgi:hypothetical protein